MIINYYTFLGVIVACKTQSYKLLSLSAGYGIDEIWNVIIL